MLLCRYHNMSSGAGDFMIMEQASAVVKWLPQQSKPALPTGDRKGGWGGVKPDGEREGRETSTAGAGG